MALTIPATKNYTQANNSSHEEKSPQNPTSHQPLTLREYELREEFLITYQNLSRKEQAIWRYMHFMANKFSVLVVSQERAAKATKCCRKTVTRTLQKFHDYGWMKKTFRKVRQTCLYKMEEVLRKLDFRDEWIFSPGYFDHEKPGAENQKNIEPNDLPPESPSSIFSSLSNRSKSSIKGEDPPKKPPDGFDPADQPSLTCHEDDKNQEKAPPKHNSKRSISYWLGKLSHSARMLFRKITSLIPMWGEKPREEDVTYWIARFGERRVEEALLVYKQDCEEAKNGGREIRSMGAYMRSILNNGRKPRTLDFERCRIHSENMAKVKSFCTAMKRYLLMDVGGNKIEIPYMNDYKQWKRYASEKFRLALAYQ